MTKLTKVQVIEMMLADEVIASNEVYTNFLAHEKELLQKKSANKKPSKTQKENEVIKTKLVEVISNSDVPMSIKDLQALDEFNGLTSQKLSPMLNALVKADKLVKSYDKKTPMFSI